MDVRGTEEWVGGAGQDGWENQRGRTLRTKADPFKLVWTLTQRGWAGGPTLWSPSGEGGLTPSSLKPLSFLTMEVTSSFLFPTTKSLLILGHALSPPPLSKASRRTVFYTGVSPRSHLPPLLPPFTGFCISHGPIQGLSQPSPSQTSLRYLHQDHPLLPPGNLLLS